MDDVSRTTMAGNGTNVLDAVGRLEDHYKLYLVVADAKLENLAQIRQIVLRQPGQRHGMRLADVASVEQSAGGTGMDACNRRWQERSVRSCFP